MRPYNFLRAFQDRFVYEPGLFPPRAGITASAVDIGRHAKELGKKPGKYCESGRCRNRLLRRASPLISGEAGVASAGLRHSYLRLGCERIRVESRGSGGT